MLQLIIGISLGVILLFVIVLLVTEMAATYPVRKQFDQLPVDTVRKPELPQRKKTKGTALMLLLCLAAFLLIAYFITNLLPPEQSKATKTTPPVSNRPPDKPRKRFADSISHPGFFFTAETKWEDGRLYCNNRVFFENPQPAPFSEMRYVFLDKDGFQLRAFSFAASDFVVETNPFGGVASLLNRSSTEMSWKEYNRVEKLQVVLDKKLPAK